MPEFVGDSDRTSSLVVERGLYVLRYTSSSSANEFPAAKVRPLADSQAVIQVISAPGSTAGELREPGAGVVLVAQSKGTVEVSVRRRRASGTLDAIIQLEPLSLEAAGLAEEALGDRRSSEIALAGASETRRARLTDPSFRFLAHISRRGDVEVASGEWAAGPAAPSPIEGLQLIQTVGERLPLEIQVRIPGPQGGWTPWAPAGTYAGTRGRALPIVGLRARLSDESDDDFDLCGEALFLGAAALNRRGAVIDLFGPYETDPLVGLRLWLESRALGQPRAGRPERLESTGVREAEVRPVRIFRSESGVRRSA
jgi:hypothetical protein